MNGENKAVVEGAVVESKPVERKLDIFAATMIAEGVDEVETEEEYFKAWQLLVDTGVCWKLQGWFGRTAQSLIEAGHISLPAKR